ncbi:hypothetical protein AN394_04154 [Pseudoalteromonas sp. P1-26]|nr:hypothetical protein AN394_04154 [Pseudoalteromonas sp. P1-26]
MFTRATFANAQGYVSRSLMNEMLLDNLITWQRINLNGIAGSSIPCRDTPP